MTVVTLRQLSARILSRQDSDELGDRSPTCVPGVHTPGLKLFVVVFNYIVPDASQLFCDDLLQDMTIQTQIGHQALQLAVLLKELAQLSQFVQAQTRILLLPQVKNSVG